MGSILVIADDFSGAAEIAGIGHRFGLPTRLFREPLVDPFRGLTVIDTDTRNRSADDAARRVSKTLGQMNAGRFDLVYKKIDSVLRGSVRAEIVAAGDVLAKGRVVLVPQNPSRGRTVVNGEYRINGTPLDQTEFARDPEHPAATAVVRGRAGLIESDSHILTPDADSTAVVQQIADNLSKHDLPVGGADFFEAILRARGYRPIAAVAPRPLPRGRLFVCGTASAQRDRLLEVASHRPAGIVMVAPGNSLSDSIEREADAIAAGGTVVVCIERGIDSKRHSAEQLQSALVDICHAILARGLSETLLAEGGSTAAAMAARLGWNEFTVQHEWAPGVVQMVPVVPEFEPRSVYMVKPGSYPWPDEVWQ